MAARLLLQRRAMAPLTAALVAGGIAFSPAVAHAEAPSNYSAKKPIYDDYDAPPTSATLPALEPAAPVAAAPTTASSVASSVSSSISSVFTSSSSSSDRAVGHARSPTPTDRLAAQIGKVRLSLYRQALSAETGVNDLLARVFDLEHSFTRTVASLAPAPESGERLMPGAVYVLVSSMAGSIFVRNRNVLLRAAGPLGFGLGAAWMLLPVTMNNVGGLLWEYERRFPVVADTHLRVREGLERAGSFARVHSRLAVDKVEESVTETRRAVEGWVAKGK